jgi:hypothetical protein
MGVCQSPADAEQNDSISKKKRKEKKNKLKTEYLKKNQVDGSRIGDFFHYVCIKIVHSVGSFFFVYFFV